MGRGKKMSKPGDGRSGDVPETCRTGGTNENHPKMNGEVVHLGQPKIYSYMSPTKSPSGRPPLQEENSVAHHESKNLGKPTTETRKKAEVEKKRISSATELSVKSSKQRETECNSIGEYFQTKQELTDVQRNTALTPVDKLQSQKMVKNKSQRRKAQRKKSPNRKLTDYYPVRRSCRKSKTELESEEKMRIDELIQTGKEDGMKMDMIIGKGRGVIATRDFQRGEFVVEYHGDLIEITDAKRREASYAQDSATGCYMYYFQYLNKTYCIDATRETGRLGRLINHSKSGNCHTKLHNISNVPHLILVASRDILVGEELLYDYGDRRKSSIEAHPWLKN
uniref:N-lysine methyltransferase KMT5A-B n=2 Tax=Xenopus laevis TaxID=8355 RepID=KT5AB_XENLA|nr:RecName: Full=N-lysine methyltransferase KMT5A-B; AltName: Full=Histone-lysine N-methyltransferase KMT5A-B; AltName: Full=Lysine-specific methylase 5A-B; AltName: Full=Mitotic phosphoprotein 36; AltName: Full=SET domain-containing protein 8-B [Xenopus laevis]AAI00247.1 Unknown (protein for MGC:115688) [Xenopus laevis]